jgi:cytochrome P450
MEEFGVTAVEARPYYDPYDAEIAADPYPYFQALREHAPLFYNEKYDFYALSKYADIERVLPDWQTFSSARGAILELIKAGIEIPPGTVLFEDPLAHDVHRNLLVRVLTPHRVAALEPMIREYCRRELDPLVGQGEFDLIKDFAANMPMRVIGMLLGIPEADQEEIRDRGNLTMSGNDGGAIDVESEAFLSGGLFAQYIDWRYDHPSDDLMTELLTAEFEDEHGVRRRLTRDEAVTYSSILAGAGNETTNRLIGWMGSTLAKHPAQRAELVADPALIPNAIEEVLRFEPPAPQICRYVTTNVEFYGRTVPAGSTLMLLYGSANRDEDRFDNAGTFDIHRKFAQHMAFGYGLHYCMGAALARLQARIALEELLVRFPSWDVKWDEAQAAITSTVRGWERLPLIV